MNSAGCLRFPFMNVVRSHVRQASKAASFPAFGRLADAAAALVGTVAPPARHGSRAHAPTRRDLDCDSIAIPGPVTSPERRAYTGDTSHAEARCAPGEVEPFRVQHLVWTLVFVGGGVQFHRSRFENGVSDHSRDKISNIRQIQHRNSRTNPDVVRNHHRHTKPKNLRRRFFLIATGIARVSINSEYQFVHEGIAADRVFSA